ncbi:hypothetical protein E1218_25820 [Kribbella turkmenica]|uniref:DUF3137 domain-containing protein n=1 Tax=Kribbella turkmenica TaxID=2530375 RepID=A0A4R4WNX1_9ACTN|nr:hypothetical protein [Kribbella turkmenica]TDD18523.1 hypothetical protein E1218_25820 [Kribbella turkmenica]
MDGLGVVGLFVVVLVAAGITWGIVALVRRRRYIKSLRDRGWTFVNSPAFDAVGRLGNPPFGLGFRRQPDDQIIGHTSLGRPFQVIEYKTEHWSGWVGMVTLSRRLPELWVTGGDTRPRYGVAATVVPAPTLGPGWQVGAVDQDFGSAVLTAQVTQRLHALAAGRPGVNLSIDGDQLVVLDPPRKEVELLGPWLELLATVATAIDAAPLDQWIQPEQPPRLTFYHHPDWYWVGVDDSLLELPPVTRSGHDHSTSEVIRGRDGDGPPFVAFSHHWKTTRTETSTDSEGRTQTRTVTEHHSEAILGFQLPARMPWLQVGRRGFGRGISFESEAFNDQFAVTAQDTKWAYDVIHPRQMEYLMANPPVSFRIADEWAWFSPGVHDQPTIAHSSAFLRGFLARIPRFVWRNLGLADSPYPPVAATPVH